MKRSTAAVAALGCVGALLCVPAREFAAESPGAEKAAPRAAATAPEISAFHVAVANINESRSGNGAGALYLYLSVFGEGLPANAVFRQVVVTKAADNQDRAIIGLGRGGRASATLASGTMQSALTRESVLGGPMQASAALGSSVRNAESIKFIEGTIEIFIPSEANGSIVRIPNIMLHGGLIEDPALSKNGIEFRIYGDEASFDEAKADGTVSNIGSNSTWSPNSPIGIAYNVRDPSNRFAGYQLQDAAGKPIPINGVSSDGSASNPGGSTGQIMLMATLPRDAQLAIFLNVPEAIRTVPFRLEDIGLP